MSILAAPAERERRIYWLVSCVSPFYCGHEKVSHQGNDKYDPLPFHQEEKVEFIKDLPFSAPPSNCLGLPVTNCNVTWRAALQNTQAQYSSNIKSKYKFGYKYDLGSNLRAPNLIFFSGQHAPKSPRVCVSYTRQMQCIVGKREQVVWSIYVVQAVKSKPFLLKSS